MDMQQNRMNEGSEKLSYAQNSLLQTNSIAKTFPVIKNALGGLYSSMTPKCVNVAELGCASGPNTLKMIPKLVDFTYEKYRAMNGKQIPQFQIFLNDQCFNDFNTVSRSLPTFRTDLEKERHGDVGQLFISMTPGSYQKRIFPDKFLHFIHCANSLHWLTKVPNALLKENEESLAKRCIYITQSSPPEVFRAYQQQFAVDFCSFLESRAQEIVEGGRMVVNMLVSSETHGPEHMWSFKLMNIVLTDMLLEGLVDEKKVSEMNIPIYPPTIEEVKRLVASEGSFVIHKHETFTLDWNMPKDSDNIHDLKSAKFVADTARVATEYMISTHFGEAFAEEFYRRFTYLVCQNIAAGIQLQTFHQVISLIRK